jgi:N-acyl-L-homoserine lactone synthetase
MDTHRQRSGLRQQVNWSMPVAGDMEVDDYDVGDASCIAGEHIGSAEVLPPRQPSCVDALLRFVSSPVIFAT